MNWLIKYTRQATVHLKDWTSFDCPEDKIQAVFDTWQNKWVLWFAQPIDWIKWIDWAMISKIEEWFSKPDIKELTSVQSSRFKNRLKEFYNNLWRNPTDNETYNIFIKAKTNK